MILAFCWCAGLLLGCFCAWQTGNVHSSLMRGAAERSVSIVGLAVVCLPFLLTVFTVLFRTPWLIYPLCFGKGFGFAFVAALCAGGFGSGGWLLRVLLLFTDGFSAPLLLFLWLSILRRPNRFEAKGFVISAVGLLVAGSIDYWLVAPFLARLI
jgi:hypothetical protein